MFFFQCSDQIPRLTQFHSGTIESAAAQGENFCHALKRFDFFTKDIIGSSDNFAVLEVFNDKPFDIADLRRAVEHALATKNGDLPRTPFSPKRRLPGN